MTAQRGTNLSKRNSAAFIVGCTFALASPATATSVDERFQSPSGNISCVINEYVAACQIARFTPSFTNRPADCRGAWGGSFYVMARGDARMGCVTVTGAGSAAALNYGESISVPQISCTSRVTGVTCTNDDGRGFIVRRAEQQIF